MVLVFNSFNIILVTKCVTKPYIILYLVVLLHKLIPINIHCSNPVLAVETTAKRWEWKQSGTEEGGGFTCRLTTRNHSAGDEFIVFYF